MDHLSNTSRQRRYRSTASTIFEIFQSHNKVPVIHEQTRRRQHLCDDAKTKWIPLSNLRRLHQSHKIDKKATCSHEHYTKVAPALRSSAPLDLFTTSPRSEWLRRHLRNVASRLWESLLLRARLYWKASFLIWMAHFVSNSLHARKQGRVGGDG